MKALVLFAWMCSSVIVSHALADAAPAGSKPLTAQEIREVFISHTWSGTVSGKPGVLTAEERKVSDRLKGKPNGKFKEYYAPNGMIMGWVGRTDFEAYTDGTWRIHGNELCASYKVHRIWKTGDVRSVVNSKWCYRFVYKAGTLLMTASRAPERRAAEIGRYHRPSLSPGNSVAPRYNSVRRK